MYHGPFLYYVTAGIFSLLGDSDLVGRLIPALLGTLIVPLLYPIYKLGYLDKKQTLIAALFLAVSPNMVYFSRFLRNDIFIAFFSMVLLVALLYYFERQKMRYALIAGAAIGLGIDRPKENTCRSLVLDLRGIPPLPCLDKEGATADSLGPGSRARRIRRGRDHGGPLLLLRRSP